LYRLSLVGIHTVAQDQYTGKNDETPFFVRAQCSV
jgi:hypothetical protein